MAYGNYPTPTCSVCGGHCSGPFSCDANLAKKKAAEKAAEARWAVVVVLNNGLTHQSSHNLTFNQAVLYAEGVCALHAGRDTGNLVGSILFSQGTSLQTFGVQDIYRLARAIKTAQ